MEQNQLKNYIESELKKGSSREQVREALIHTGWKPENIDEVFNLLEQENSLKKQNNKSGNKSGSDDSTKKESFLVRSIMIVLILILIIPGLIANLGLLGMSDKTDFQQNLFGFMGIPPIINQPIAQTIAIAISVFYIGWMLYLLLRFNIFSCVLLISLILVYGVFSPAALILILISAFIYSVIKGKKILPPQRIVEKYVFAFGFGSLIAFDFLYIFSGILFHGSSVHFLVFQYIYLFPAIMLLFTGISIFSYLYEHDRSKLRNICLAVVFFSIFVKVIISYLLNKSLARFLLTSAEVSSSNIYVFMLVGFSVISLAILAWILYLAVKSCKQNLWKLAYKPLVVTIIASLFISIIGLIGANMLYSFHSNTVYSQLDKCEEEMTERGMQIANLPELRICDEVDSYYESLQKERDAISSEIIKFDKERNLCITKKCGYAISITKKTMRYMMDGAYLGIVTVGIGDTYKQKIIEEGFKNSSDTKLEYLDSLKNSMESRLDKDNLDELLKKHTNQTEELTKREGEAIAPYYLISLGDPILYSFLHIDMLKNVVDMRIMIPVNGIYWTHKQKSLDDGTAIFYEPVKTFYENRFVDESVDSKIVRYSVILGSDEEHI